MSVYRDQVTPRRRAARWRRTAGGLLAAVCVTAAVTPLHAAPAQAAISNTAAFTMTWTPDSAAGYVNMVKASMTAVIDDGLYGLVHRGTQCDDAKGSAAVIDWYCFDDVDASSWKDPEVGNAWVPQGMTTTSDMNTDETWNGRSASIVGWYHGAPGDADGPNGIRISVINWATGEYRHVLLVDAFGTSPAGYSAIKIHAGGLLWYGRYLYVPDTANGIRVFSLDNIYDLGASTNGTTSCSYIGLQNGTYCAAQYKYVIPQIGYWKVSSPAASADFCNPDSGKARFSYLAVDRPNDPDRLIVGEFCESTKSVPGRLAAYPMASAVPGAGSTLSPSWVKNLPSKQIQGAATNGIYWYFNKSNGHSNGSLLQTTETSTTFTIGASRTTPIGPEDLSFWRSTGQLWSVSEYYQNATPTYGRMIYSMPTNF